LAPAHFSLDTTGASVHNQEVPVDPSKLPNDRRKLKQMVVDYGRRIDKLEAMLESVVEAQRMEAARKSEQLTKDQLALFEARETAPEIDEDDLPPPAATSDSANKPASPRGRQPLPKHLKRERIEHDLTENEKHCARCNTALRRFGEETSERLEYIPAQWKVIEEVCYKYACKCLIHTATKPSQPLEKSLAGPSLLAQVIVAKFSDHLPLHRQAKMYARSGVALSEQTMGDWLRSCAELLSGLYEELKSAVLASKVVGTDDTAVAVRIKGLDHTKSSRIWPYVGERLVAYDFTLDRSRAGPEAFLREYRGFLQADAYPVYDAFFKNKRRGLTEVGCLAHARRHVYEALETDSRLQGVLHWIAKLYAVEKHGRECGALGGAVLTALRAKFSKPIVKRLRKALEHLRDEMLPKSAAGKAVNYLLRHWTALTRFASDGDVPIDNNRTERAIRPWAIGRNNWTFFGSPRGGKTAAVLMSFVSSCKLQGVDPYEWFCDVLTRIADHPQSRLAELLPDRWKTAKVG
jgi:transposase